MTGTDIARKNNCQFGLYYQIATRRKPAVSYFNLIAELNHPIRWNLEE
jgi:hypothetical protein